MDSLSDIVRAHTNQYSFAADVQARQYRGERILGHDAFECGCGCGKIINLDNWDVGGPDWIQPDGFYDDLCMQWFHNDCGNRKRRRCEDCVTYLEAVALVSLSMQIRDSLTDEINSPSVALSCLRDMIGIEAQLGRRLRKMIAKQQTRQIPQTPQISLKYCDPKTCTECQNGAA